jgi:hypothetical protein
MSNGRFEGLARAYLADMIYAQTPLHKLQSLFWAGKDVQSYHCDFVISTLASFTKAVRSFDLLLRERASYSISLSMKYQILAFTVDQLDDQEYQIKSIIDVYRPYCQLYSKQVLIQKHEIQRMIKTFVQRTDTFLQQVAHLIEETHSPEKKAVLLYPDYESYEEGMQHKEGITILLYRHFTLPRATDYVQ